MFSKKALRIFGMALMLVFAMSSPAWAVMGDCDGDGVNNIADAVYIVYFLFSGGQPPISMFDCDCDGFAGVSIGDAFQIIGSIYGSAILYPALGMDLPVPSHVEFFYNTSFPLDKPSFKIGIYVDVPPGNSNDIASFILPFSFAATDGQLSVICNSIDFSGSVSNPQLSSDIDNANEWFIIQGNSVYSPNPCLPGSTKGLLCTVNFTAGAGVLPNALKLTSTDRIWPMLFHTNFYAGVNGQRVFLPEFIRADYGDANCDGMVNVSDAVYIINYVFVPGSPKPGDCEP